MALPTIDAGFPVLATQTGTTQAVTSATFNVAASRLMVVLVCYDADPNTNFPSTVTWNGGTPAGAAAFTKATGIGGTSGHVGTFCDVAEVWTAWVTSALTGVSVTCSLPSAASTGQDRAIFVESWANTQATLGGVNSVFSTASGTRAVSVVCTGTGSVVVGVCGSFFTGGAGVADANSTLDGNGNVGADTQAALHLATPTSGPGTFTIGLAGTDTDRVAAAIELLASATTGLQTGRGPWSSPRDAPSGPASRFRHATWASTQVVTGTVYNDTLSEALSLADAFATVAAFPNASTEAISLTDAMATNATLGSSLSEAVTLADALTSAATFPNAISEIVTPAESFTTAVAFTNALSEPVTLADTLSTVAVFGSTMMEALALGDSPSTTATFPSAFTEPITLGESFFDTLTGGGTTYNDTITEAVTLADALATSAIFSSAFSEAIALGDAVATTAVLWNTMADGFTLSDSLASVLNPTGGTIIRPVFVWDD